MRFRSLTVARQPQLQNEAAAPHIGAIDRGVRDTLFSPSRFLDCVARRHSNMGLSSLVLACSAPTEPQRSQRYRTVRHRCCFSRDRLSMVATDHGRIDSGNLRSMGHAAHCSSAEFISHGRSPLGAQATRTPAWRAVRA